MKTILGTYGSNKIENDILVDDSNGWYCVAGSSMVNRVSACNTHLLIDGVDVEELPDVDCFTWSNPIETEEEFETAIEA